MKKLLKRTLIVVLSIAVLATFTPMFNVDYSSAASKVKAPTSFTGTATKKNKVFLKWSKSKGATSYVIFKNGKILKTVKGLKFTDKKVKKGKIYKYAIVAKKGKSKSAKSFVIKVKAKKDANAKSVSVALDKEVFTLDVANAAEAKVGGKAFSTSVEWFSSDSSVAKIAKDGKITAVAEGVCTITARAHNGITKAVKLKVVPAATEAYINGKIYTVEGEDWDQAPERAMAIKDGMILAVGSKDEIDVYCNDNTDVVKLGGKAVYPGFIDSHDHPPGTAMTDLFEINNYYDFKLGETKDTIAAFIEAHPDQDVYWGSGYNQAMLEGTYTGVPCEELDEICDTKPIILTSNDGHSRWLNSKAMEECGIDADTQADAGGKIGRKENGDPNGILTDSNSCITLKKSYTHEQNIQGMEKFVADMNKWGFTGCSTGGQTSVDLAAELDKQDKLYLRMNFSSNFYPTEDFTEAGIKENVDRNIENLHNNIKTVEGCKNVMVKTSKFFEDGVVEGYTAYMSKPYVGKAAKDMGDNWVSEPKWLSQVDLAENMAATAKEGSQIHVHAIGDQAISDTIDGIAYAQEQAGDQDYRNVITHLQVVQNKDKERMGELGIIGALQPFWHLKEPDWFYEVDNDVLGEKRAWKEYPAKSLQDNGVLLTFSGDFPVSPTNNPFWAIEASVTRNLNAPDYYGVDDILDEDDPTYLLNPKERVSLKTAIEAYTINGAYQMYEEDLCGSLKAGKVADFLVLREDPMKVDVLDLDSIQVLQTYKDGKVVYDYNSAE